MDYNAGGQEIQDQLLHSAGAHYNSGGIKIPGGQGDEGKALCDFHGGIVTRLV